MYETQFGLNKPPFRALAQGSDVFVGPQTAAAMAGLKKALASPDAIVAVGGPVGVGKTTVVRRALQAIGSEQVIIWVGRMQLGHDEVLELLLEEMGIELPTGTVQRFTAFRRQLKQHADDGSRVFIVVEDAARIGHEALAELEALTASDAGVSEGANIVLMGDEGLDPLIKLPQLARLRQRLRLRQSIAPLSTSELLGYLKHCFRLAGNEFDQVFENGSADVLHRLSGGIPRITNNLVESSLISAVENKLERVNVAQIKLVASEEYGLSLNNEVAPEVAAEPAPVATPEPQPVAAEPEPPVIQPEPSPPPAAEAALPEDDIPELIQDTLPDLEVLSPNLAKPAAPQPVQKPVDAPSAPPKAAAEPAAPTPQPQSAAPAAQPQPTAPAPQPQNEAAPPEQLNAAQVEPPGDAVPEWERDPTLAQLRPDLDALEQAMAVAQGLAPEEDDDDAMVKPAQAPESDLVITLDREIQAKVDEAAEKLREEEERRAAAEAAAEKESGIDNRPTSEILADAKARDEADSQVPDNSVEAQFEAALPTAESPSSDNMLSTSDTIHELPVLTDATEPAFMPAEHRQPEPTSQAAPPPEPAQPAAPPPQPKPAPQPKSAPQPEAAPQAELTPKPEATPAPNQAPTPQVEPAASLDNAIADLPELELESEPQAPSQPAAPAEPPAAAAPAPEPEPEPEPEIAVEPEPDPEELEKARKADEELEQIAENLARAKTIDDCDDKMAETLFGEEFSMMAAQVAAMAPPELSANDDLEDPLELEATEEPAPAAEPSPEFEGAAALSVELETAPNGLSVAMDTSASQRLAQVRELNSGVPESPRARIGGTSTCRAAATR